MEHLKYEVIKHKRCIDVAFLLLKCYPRKDSSYRIHGWWINISNPENVYPMTLDWCTIKPEEIKNWDVYNVN